VPEGFSLIGIADDLPAITSIAFGPDGALYAGLRFNGIMRLVDSDGDRRYETRNLFAGGFNELLGLAWLADTLYVSSIAQVTTLRDADGDAIADTRTIVIDNLPVGRHQNDSLVFGPDDRLYMPLGSTCDACQEANALNASILSFNPDGSDMQILARGLRNAFDLAFNAQGQLFATDNGRDDLGPSQPPEELNHIIPGAHYGWPDCWGRGQGSNCENTQPPIAEFDARASADGLVFYYADQFPTEYVGNAFVALFGSYVVDVAPRVVRVQLEPSGDTFTAQISDFVTGIGRPLDLAVGPDGALYIADFETEAIFRVNHGAP
jgi:glucose/arabinose dehydrogenase